MLKSRWQLADVPDCSDESFVSSMSCVFGSLFGHTEEEYIPDAESVYLHREQHHQPQACTLAQCFQLYTKEEQVTIISHLIRLLPPRNVYSSPVAFVDTKRQGCCISAVSAFFKLPVLCKHPKPWKVSTQGINIPCG